MKTIYDPVVRTNLTARIAMLNEHSTALWGSMSIFQMLKHCRMWEEMILGKTHYPRMFIGRIVGKRVLKTFLSDELPMPRNAPTVPAFKIKEISGDVAAEKQRWLRLIAEEADVTTIDFIHPFFGRMTKDQIGRLAYKHIDHHLRQFNS